VSPRLSWYADTLSSSSTERAWADVLAKRGEGHFRAWLPAVMPAGTMRGTADGPPASVGHRLSFIAVALLVLAIAAMLPFAVGSALDDLAFRHFEPEQYRGDPARVRGAAGVPRCL
jgi:hypothetical protein